MLYSVLEIRVVVGTLQKRMNCVFEINFLLMISSTCNGLLMQPQASN